jgi:hypothetical protein
MGNEADTGAFQNQVDSLARAAVDLLRSDDID